MDNKSSYIVAFKQLLRKLWPVTVSSISKNLAISNSAGKMRETTKPSTQT